MLVLGPRDAAGDAARHSQCHPSSCPRAWGEQGGVEHLGRVAWGLPKGMEEPNPLRVSCPITEEDSLLRDLRLGKAMNSTGKMVHDRNITPWLAISLARSAAVGKHARVEPAWAGRGECQAGFNPPSHGLMQTPARAGNRCCQRGHILQSRCSSSRRSRPGLAGRVRVQPLLVSIPGLQKVQICLSNSDLGRQERQLQYAFSYIHTYFGLPLRVISY